LLASASRPGRSFSGDTAGRAAVRISTNESTAERIPGASVPGSSGRLGKSRRGRSSGAVESFGRNATAVSGLKVSPAVARTSARAPERRVHVMQRTTRVEHDGKAHFLVRLDLRRFNPQLGHVFPPGQASLGAALSDFVHTTSVF